MWAANQATQGLGQIMGTLTEAEGRAGNYLTEGYATGQDVLGGGYADSMEALRQGYGTGRGDLQAAHRLANTNIATGNDYTQALLREGRDRGFGQLQAGQDAGVGALTAGRDQGINALYSGRDQGINALYGGRDQALGYLGQAGTQLQGAADAYNPLIQRGMAGYDMYSNSLGINGPEGNAAARGAFQAGPGYQWQVEQATDAAQRAANRTGSLYGGNVVDATTRLGSNLANQEYGNWQNRLQPYMGAAQAATAGRAGQLDLLAQNYGRMGDVATTAGQGAANLYGTTGSQASNLYGTTGSQLSNLYSTTGNQLANLSSTTGQAMGSAERAAASDRAHGTIRVPWERSPCPPLSRRPGRRAGSPYNRWRTRRAAVRASSGGVWARSSLGLSPRVRPAPDIRDGAR